MGKCPGKEPWELLYSTVQNAQTHTSLDKLWVYVSIYSFNVWIWQFNCNLNYLNIPFNHHLNCSTKLEQKFRPNCSSFRNTNIALPGDIIVI